MITTNTATAIDPCDTPIGAANRKTINLPNLQIRHVVFGEGCHLGEVYPAQSELICISGEATLLMSDGTRVPLAEGVSFTIGRGDLVRSVLALTEVTLLVMSPARGKSIKPTIEPNPWRM